MERVGRVVGLFRYPLKSMAGEALGQATLGRYGVDGDRQYAFYRLDDRSRFPWLSGRDLAELVLWRARFRFPDDPRRSPLDVVAPDGERFEAGSEALLSRLSAAAGCALGLLQVNRGTFDAMPVSVASTATHAAIDARLGRPADPRRFRHNILVEPVGGARETGWSGRSLQFGEPADGPRLAVHEAIPRCALVTIDPDSGVKDPAVLRTVAQDFANEIGVYACPLRRGGIKVGDPVFLD